MSVNKTNPAKRGRPRRFEPEAALDCAAELFWRHGFEGVDVESIAARIGIAKPSLYRLFGDKETLFVKALARYGETVGAGPLRVLHEARGIREAVLGCLTAALDAATQPGGPSGCLITCVAAQCAENLPQVRASYAAGLAAVEESIARRLRDAITQGELPALFPVAIRVHLMVDLMQATALRARSGMARAALAPRIAAYADLILA